MVFERLTNKLIRSSFVGEASGNKNSKNFEITHNELDLTESLNIFFAGLKFVVIGHKLRDDTALEEALKV